MHCFNVTGLDVNKCTILEMACIITDGQLNIVAEVSCLCTSQVSIHFFM